MKTVEIAALLERIAATAPLIHCITQPYLNQRLCQRYF